MMNENVGVKVRRRFHVWEGEAETDEFSENHIFVQNLRFVASSVPLRITLPYEVQVAKDGKFTKKALLHEGDTLVADVVTGFEGVGRCFGLLETKLKYL